MKARIKKTGEIVDVYFEGQNGSPMTDIFRESVLVNARMFRGDELDILNPTQLDEEKHWQDVREHAAIAALNGTITILGSYDRHAFREVVVEGFSGNEKTYPNEIAEFAIACADALVKQLKGE